MEDTQFWVKFLCDYINIGVQHWIIVLNNGSSFLYIFIVRKNSKMWLFVGLLFDSSKVVIAVVFLQMLGDLAHVFGGPLEVFAASLLKAIDAELAAILHDSDVPIPYWIICSFHGVEGNQDFALRVFLVLFDEVLLILLDHKPQILNLTLGLL